RRTVLGPVPTGDGPLLPLSGRHAAALASARESGAAGDRAGWRVAVGALERRPIRCLPRPERGAYRLRADQRGRGREGRLVRPRRGAADTHGSLGQEIAE